MGTTDGNSVFQHGVWVAAPLFSDLTCGWRRNCPWAVGRRTVRPKKLDRERLLTCRVGREPWLCQKSSEVASPESSTFLRGRCRETLGGRSHIGSVTFQARHTPGGGRSGHIWSAAQQWNLTQQRSGQTAPPHPTTPSCLLRGRLACCRPGPSVATSSLSLWAAPYGEEGDEAVPEVARGFGGRDLFLFLHLSHKVRD